MLQHTSPSSLVLSCIRPNPWWRRHFYQCRIPPSLMPKFVESRRLSLQPSPFGPMLLSSRGVSLMPSCSCIDMWMYRLSRSSVAYGISCNWRTLSTAREASLSAYLVVWSTTPLQTDYSSYNVANLIDFRSNSGSAWISHGWSLRCFGAKLWERVRWR